MTYCLVPKLPCDHSHATLALCHYCHATLALCQYCHATQALCQYCHATLALCQCCHERDLQGHRRKGKLLSLSRKRKREASPLYDEEELVDRYKAQVKDDRRKKTTKKTTKKVSKKEEDETGQFAVSFRKIMAPSLLTLWFPQ